ncbi:MAG: hypothetical protein KTR31_19790 [Myxococcales bacterium]|nr:hypothetical protein [Myxococcales bacterium]
MRTWVLTLMIPFAGCSGDTDTMDEPSPTGTEAPEPRTFTLTNTGNESREGHTPRGFQGQGTGLFAGDNLNSGFPEGDGVQIFVSVNLAQADEGDLTDGTWEVSEAIFAAEAMEVRGTPFADLGNLNAEEVVFDEFSSALWDLPAVDGGASCVFADGPDGDYACDLAPAVQAALDDGRRFVSFRLLFDQAGDSDGEQDMALFFLTDSNTTDKGIFSLTVEATPVP